MLAISNDDVAELLPDLDIIAAVEAAAIAQQDPHSLVPQRQHVDVSGDTLLIMPAVAAGHIGVKLVSVNPGNAGRRLPVTNGIMILIDGETGQVVAIINAATLTAIRTGAVGALGAKFMTPSNLTSVGIVGCGVQGAWQAIFACAVRPIQEIFCVARSLESFQRFAATVRRHVPKVRITPCRDAADLLERSSGGGLVIAATTSTEPVLPDIRELLEGRHFISIGSYKPEMQELPDSVFRLAGHLVLDSESARHEVGDAIRPVQQQVLSVSDIFAIAELITGRRTVNTDATTVYKCTGMALFDLHVARVIYRAARQKDIGCELTL